MIEVEKKFELDEDSQAKLLAGTSFVSEKTFTDTYFDTKDFSLTTKDIWLRDRGGRFELKIPLNDAWDKRVSDQYRELETNAEIAEFLGFPRDTAIEEILRVSGYMPFASITTTRRKYQKDKFIIDIDVLDFGYQIAEIELMVERESDIPMAVGEITAGDGKVMPVMEYYQVRQTATPTDAWIWDRKEEAIKRHFEKVAGADAILVLNHDKKGIVGYIGANTLMEMGLALHLGKRIYLLNQIPEISYREEILGMKPKVINGDFAQIV